MMDFEQGTSHDTDNDTVFQFSEKTVRLGFLRKVYAILSLQLLLTSAVIGIFISVPAVKGYVGSAEGSWVSGVSMFGVFGFLIAMACFEKPRRSWPTNIICLLGFTLFESVLLGSITCRYDTGMVLTAAGLTALVTFGLTLYALQTKYDFTTCGGILFVCLFSLIGFSIISFFMPSQVMQVAISSMGAMLFGVYLIYDTQIMLGGHHKYALSPEEYIFAALNLYLDIVNLFLYILSILNEGKRN